MGKRGISAIVATVLTILITIAGVTIMWVAVVPVIKNSIAFEGVDARLFVETGGGYTLYDSDNNVACVQIKRGSDESEISGAEIIFNIDGDSQKVIVEAPGPNQRRTYCFDFIGYSAPQEVGVAPVIIIGGNNRTGKVTSKVEIAESLLVEVPAREDLIGVGGKNFVGGAILFYDFENIIGGVVPDLIGENNGSLTGVTEAVSDSERESVLRVDTGKYISINNIDLGDEFSISIWAKYANFNSSRFNLLSFYGGYNTTGYRFGFPGNNRFRFWTTQSVTTPPLVGLNLDNVTRTVSLDEWYHVVVTYDSPDGKMYLDGVEIASGAGLFVSPGSNTLTISKGLSGGTWGFNGSVDDVMIFDKALREDEVLEIYNFQS